MDIKYITLIIVQVLFIFIFLSIFYFSYASTKEGVIVQNQVDFLVNNIAQENLHLLTPDKKKFLLNAINGIQSNTPENIQLTNQINDSNTLLINKTKNIIGIVVICTVIFIIKFPSGQLKPIIKESLIILVFIMITEYIFLNTIPVNYVAVKPNIIKAQFCENISKGFSQ